LLGSASRATFSFLSQTLAMAFSFEPTEIPDVVLVRPETHHDRRGFFKEVYQREAFHQAGIDANFQQDNVTRSGRGVLRGLHYQLPPGAQGKIIGVIQGAIYDVAVDLRHGSPAFGRWVGRALDDTEGAMLWIPAGFAHGYAVLSETADVSYKVTGSYRPDLARGIAWDDPELAIDWQVEAPILSDADRAQPSFADCENTFRYDAE